MKRKSEVTYIWSIVVLQVGNCLQDYVAFKHKESLSPWESQIINDHLYFTCGTNIIKSILKQCVDNNIWF